MRSHRLLLLPLLALVSALALAACGSSESDEDKIVDAIESSVTGTDPAICTEFATQAFVDQNSDGEGAAALKECEEDAEDTSNDPDSVEVAEVEVDGENGTAEVAFTGGAFDGQTLSVALLKEDDDWKLDEITGFAVFDQEGLVQAFNEQFESEDSIEPAVTSCIVEVLEELSQPEFEELLLGGSSEGFVEIAESCE